MYIRRFISVVSAAVSVGVCVFITYISRDVDFDTILFNLVFLAAMLIMLAAAWLIGIRRLMGVCKGLQRAAGIVKNGDTVSVSTADGAVLLFENEFLDDCYQQYCRMVRRNPDGSCDIRDFINEESVEEYVHRGILELIPDILTSLGILGTFVGLVMGLREFDPSGYEQMAGSVTPLINGIKVAFITSIYGISLSLAFSFNLRSEFGNLSALVESFLDAYYLNVRPPHDIDSVARLVGHRKEQEDMEERLAGLIGREMSRSLEAAVTPAFERMSDGINQVVSSFTENQEEVLMRVCEAVTQQMRAELTADFDQISRAVTELEKSQADYTSFMDRSLARMQQTFATMQDHMRQSDEYNAQSLRELTSAQQEAYRITQEQKATYQEYIRFMYQTIEKFSEVWDKNSQKLQEYSDEIAKMGPVQSNLALRNDLARIANMLEDMQRSQLAADSLRESSAADEETAELLSRALRKLDAMEEMLDRPRLFGGRRRKTDTAQRSRDDADTRQE